MENLGLSVEDDADSLRFANNSCDFNELTTSNGDNNQGSMFGVRPSGAETVGSGGGMSACGLFYARVSTFVISEISVANSEAPISNALSPNKI